MKHSFNRMILVVTAAAITFIGCAIASNTEKAKAVDFNNYKFFTFQHEANKYKSFGIQQQQYGMIKNTGRGKLFLLAQQLKSWQTPFHRQYLPDERLQI